MKCGTKTGLYDKNDKEICMCDRLKLYDSDGRVHKILVGFSLGMFVEDGTTQPLHSIISAYDECDGSRGVEIIVRKKKS